VYGGPDGELGASMRYLSQRYSMKDDMAKALLTDIGTEEADPNIYKFAVEKIGKPIDEIIFLDDNYNANKTAKLAEMSVCGVYDSSSEEYVYDINNIADYYIYNFSELLEI